jgi:predicted enzyme related to lactoylglutathione lyase
MAIAGVRYVHTNLMTTDWRKLAQFYIDLFGCEIVPPVRDYHNPDLESLTALPGAHLRGVHLRLPGFPPGGPTLEIYDYTEMVDRLPAAVNRPGFGHLAFAVDDVHAARQAVLDAGGRAVGEVVTLTTATGGRVTCCYVTDPEDNILELQSWA